MLVGIVKDDFFESHSTSWGHEWIKNCKELEVEYIIVDWKAPNALNRLLKCQVVLWHFSHYSLDEMTFARSFLNALDLKGVKVFPGHSDSWHFDDKVAQAMIFEALDIPSPKNTILFSKDAVEDWIEHHATFPVVSKLRTGSGSQNVILIQNAEELRQQSDKMFGSGAKGKPKLAFKAWSNLKSARSFTEVWKRAMRAPEFIFSRNMASQLPKEKNYVYLQNFVMCTGYDIKVVVVNNKLSFLGRKLRKGDFRASGGADLFHDRDIMSAKIIRTAFDAADKFGSVCTGMDFVVDKLTGNVFIIEVSYGFSYTALIQAQGYFDRSEDWHDQPLNAPAEVLSALIEQSQDL